MHLRKNAPISFVLNDLANLNLTHDNLIILYTSAYLGTINAAEEDMKRELEHLIQQICTLETDWRILKMD